MNDTRLRPLLLSILMTLFILPVSGQETAGSNQLYVRKEGVLKWNTLLWLKENANNRIGRIPSTENEIKSS